MKKLLERIEYRSTDIVFVAGSVAEGWSNSRSDIDVYIVGQDHSRIPATACLSLPGSPHCVKLGLSQFESKTLECQYWHSSDVASLAEALRDHPLRPLTELWAHGVQFIHRLRTGTALHNRNELEALRGTIDFRWLEEYLFRFNMRVYESYYNDALAALETKSHDDALLMSTLAVEHVLDAYLAVRGETNSQAKWRHRKLLRHDGPDSPLAAEYSSLRRGYPELARSAEPTQLQRALRFAESVNCAIQLGWEYSVLRPGTAFGPARASSVRLVRPTDHQICLLSLTERAVHEINHTAAAIWSRLDGTHTLDDIAKYIAGHSSASPGEASRTVADFTAHLGDRGLLDSP